MSYHNSTTPVVDRDQFKTPQFLFSFAKKIIGGIDWDTACTRANMLAPPVWHLQGDDGGDALIVEWQGRCWCNPPYSDIKTWANKAISSKDAITAFLIPSPNGESYYDKLIAHSHEIHIVGRIAFIGADGKPKNGNNRGSSLFIVNGYAPGSRSVVYRDDLIAEFGTKNQIEEQQK